MPPTTVLRPTYNQVTKQNLTSLQPIIIQLLKQADFLALDAEFTGLGPKAAATRASDIQERYKNMCRLAGTHALVAFGLSIFIRTSPSPAKATDSTRAMDLDNDSKEEQKEKLHSNEKISYREDYMVSPNSMIFLAENGLDLNQWVQEGIPYKAGDRLKNDGGRGNPNGIMRSIFKRIMSRGVPVVVHNGFLDIVFLYHSFYADLPASLQTFVADMSDMFPGGLYDTKYGSDYITRERSSFLAYLYRKYQRFDLRAAEQHRNQLSISKSESIDHDPMDGTQNNESNFQSEPSQSTTPAVSSDPEPTLYSSFDVQPQLVLPAMPDLDPPVDNSVAGSTGIKICEDYA
ncbi:Target of EGR1, member 1 (Nuclear), partial [Lunasporangiospora selenospora]